MTEPLRVALAQHDFVPRELPDAMFRLRKIGDRPERMSGVEPRVLDPDDAAAHVALYRELARR